MTVYFLLVPPCAHLIHAKVETELPISPLPVIFCVYLYYSYAI